MIMFVDLLMKFRFIYLCLIVVFIVITIIIAILVFFFQYIFESNDDYARKKKLCPFDRSVLVSVAGVLSTT